MRPSARDIVPHPSLHQSPFAHQPNAGAKIELVFEAIQHLIEAPVQPKRRIGFPVGRSDPEAEVSEPEGKE